MVLKTENDDTKAASFLELDVEVKDRIFSAKLFDKRDAFNFSVVRMPYKCSNMPSKMFYSAISAEVLRICRATSNYDFFIESVRKIVHRMRKQGAETIGLNRIVKKMMGRHWEPFIKFDLPVEHIASDISSLN